MEQKTIFKCVVCGNFIPDGRADKRYDTRACRQKFYRWKHATQRYENNIAKAVTDLVGYLQYPETRQDAIDKLSASIKLIKELSRSNGVVFKEVK